MSLGLDKGTRGKRLAHAETASSFVTLTEGTVTLRSPQTATAIACGSRCALTAKGEIVCTYMVQAAIGLNDFCPMLARSVDQGLTWSEERPLWPHLRERFSFFGSVSTGHNGELLFYGMRTPIDIAGESSWCEATQGLKANDLIWARSTDGGQSLDGAGDDSDAICRFCRSAGRHVCDERWNLARLLLTLQHVRSRTSSTAQSGGIDEQR